MGAAITLDEDELRATLQRYLAPSLVSTVIAEATAQPIEKPSAPSPALVEQHRRRLREKRKLTGRDE